MSLTVTHTKTIGTTEQVKVNRYGDGTLEYQRLLATTGDTTSGNATIANVANTNGIFKGAPISGGSLPAGATVASFVANTSITVDSGHKPTATTTGVALVVNKTVADSSAQPPAKRVVPSGRLGDFINELIQDLAATS